MKKKIMLSMLMIIIAMFINIGDCYAAKKQETPGKGCNQEFEIKRENFSSSEKFDELITMITAKPSGSYCAYHSNVGYLYGVGSIESTGMDGTIERVIFYGKTAEDVYTTMSNLNVWSVFYNGYCKSGKNQKMCEKLDKARKEITNPNDSNSSQVCTYNFSYEGIEESIDLTVNPDDESVIISSPPSEGVADSQIIKPGKYILYFNEYKKSFDDFQKDYISLYKSKNNCPNLYFAYGADKKTKWYTTFSEAECTNVGKYSGICSQSNGNGVTDKIITDYEAPEFPDLIGGESTIKVCSDLILEGGDLQKILKGIVNVVKILVPIALLALGILDFAQAIFSSSEDAMKKAQGKFIKRVIIAVVIFLIPIVLEVLLGLASKIWPVISSDLCGIL